VLEHSVARIKTALWVCFPLNAAVGLAFLPLVRRQPWLRFFLATAAITWAAIFMEQPLWITPEYTAPLFGLNTLLMTFGIRGMSTLRFGSRHIGRRLPVLIMAGAAVSFTTHCLRTEKLGPYPEPVQQRLKFIRLLQETPGKDMVFVFTPTASDYTFSWLHNSPDLDTAQIIWARALNPEADQMLRSHFADRRAWSLTWQENRPTLQSLDNIE